MKSKKHFLTLLALSVTNSMPASTLVYGMRIHRIFTQASLLEKYLPGIKHLNKKKHSSTVSLAPIIQHRTRNFPDPIKNMEQYDRRLIGGILLNLRHVAGKHWWCEATTGLLYESAREWGATRFKARRLGFDDIFVSAGHNWHPSKKSQVVLKGIVTVPTKRSLTTEDTFGPLVGTRLFSVGCGLECSHLLKATPECAITVIEQFRLLHFFSRNWTPILPKGVKLVPGEAIDFLMALRYRCSLSNVEVGYNPTIFINQATRSVDGSDLRVCRFTQHNVYINYLQFCKNIKLWDKPTIFGYGLSLTTSNKFNTRSVAAWLSANVIF